MAYITEQEIEQYSGIDIPSTMSTLLGEIISGIEKLIEETTGRKFVAPTPDNDETRYYDGNGLKRLNIDDLRSITSLVVDGVSLVKDVDYYLYPLNAVADGKPYEAIELVQSISGSNRNPRAGTTYIFEEDQRNVVITGKFGYSASLPSAIKLASLKIASAIIKENVARKELSSESLGEYSVSYMKIADVADSMNFEKVLAPYIKKTVAGKKSSGGYIAV